LHALNLRRYSQPPIGDEPDKPAPCSVWEGLLRLEMDTEAYYHAHAARAVDPEVAQAFLKLVERTAAKAEAWHRTLPMDDPLGKVARQSMVGGFDNMYRYWMDQGHVIAPSTAREVYQFHRDMLRVLRDIHIHKAEEADNQPLRELYVTIAVAQNTDYESLQELVSPSSGI